MAFTNDAAGRAAAEEFRLSGGGETAVQVDEIARGVFDATQPVAPSTPQPTSFQDTNLFVDPNTAALFQTGLQTGDVSGLAASFFQSPERRRQEEERRAGVLQTGVQATGRAAVLTGSEQARRTFQRQGKALSSAVVFGEGGLLDVSEAAKATSEATFARGLGEIFRDVGQEFGQREALGVDIFGVGVGAKTQKEVARIGAAAVTGAAGIAARSAEGINAARILSAETIAANELAGRLGETHDTRTHLNDGSINPDFGRLWADIMNDRTTFRGMSRDVDLRETLPDNSPNPNYLKPTDVTIQGNEHTFNTVNDPDSDWDGMPSWMIGYDIKLLDTNNAYKLAMDAIELEYYKIDLASADGWAQFTATQDFLRDEFNITIEQEWAMFTKTLELQVRDQNIDIAQFSQTLGYAKQKDWYDDDLARDLTVLALTAETNNKYTSDVLAWSMWQGDMAANLLNLGVSTSEQHWYATQVLKQAIPGIVDNRMKTIATTTLAFMEDPIFLQVALGGTVDEDGLVTFDDTLYDEGGNVVPKGTPGGMTKADRVLATLYPAIEGMFFRTFDDNGNGIVEPGEGGGEGGIVAKKILARNLALELGLDPADYGDVNQIIRDLAEGKIPEGIIPDYEPVADDYTVDTSPNSGYDDPGDTSGDIADDIFKDAGDSPTTGDLTPGQIGDSTTVRLTATQRKYRGKVVIAVSRAGYASFEELPEQIRTAYHNAILESDFNDRLNSEEYLNRWLKKNPKGGA